MELAFQLKKKIHIINNFLLWNSTFQPIKQLKNLEAFYAAETGETNSLEN